MNKKLLCDLLVACGVLLAAAVLYFIFRPGQAGVWAVVAVDGEQTARYPLDQDITIRVGEQDSGLRGRVRRYRRKTYEVLMLFLLASRVLPGN